MKNTINGFASMRICFIFLIALCSNQLFAQVVNARIKLSDPAKIYKLDGQWKFKPHDDLRYANPDYDDSKWKLFQVPGSWGRQGYDYKGIGWFRVALNLDADFKSKTLGLRSPYIASSHEVYINGVKLGGQGKISPKGSMEESNMRVNYYNIPAHLIRWNRPNILTFRVSNPTGGGGFYFSSISIGESGILRKSFDNYLILKSALGFILFFIAIYSILLFIGRRSEIQYLYSAIISFLFSSVVIGLSTLSYWIIDSAWFNLFLYHISIIMGPYFLVKFLHEHFEEKENRLIIPLKITTPLFLIVLILCPFSLNLTIFYFKIVLIPVLGTLSFYILYSIIFNIIMIRKNKSGARTIGIGFTIMCMTGILNVLSMYNLVQEIRLTDFGFLWFYCKFCQ